MDPQVGDMQSTAAPTTHSGDSEDAAVVSRSAAGFIDTFYALCSRVISWAASLTTDHRELCSQVECYGRGDVHTDIMKLLNISICEKPGIPLVLFVYKVSRETVDLRNALQWIEDNRGRKREDICAVILLEKSSDTDKNPVEVAHPGMFDEKTAVVRIRWKHEQTHLREPSVKIQEDDSTKSAINIIKRSILGWQSDSKPEGGGGQRRSVRSVCLTVTAFVVKTKSIRDRAEQSDLDQVNHGWDPPVGSLKGSRSFASFTISIGNSDVLSSLLSALPDRPAASMMQFKSPARTSSRDVASSTGSCWRTASHSLCMGSPAGGDV